MVQVGLRRIPIWYKDLLMTRISGDRKMDLTMKGRRPQDGPDDEGKRTPPQQTTRPQEPGIQNE